MHRALFQFLLHARRRLHTRHLIKKRGCTRAFHGLLLAAVACDHWLASVSHPDVVDELLFLVKVRVREMVVIFLWLVVRRLLRLRWISERVDAQGSALLALIHRAARRGMLYYHARVYRLGLLLLMLSGRRVVPHGMTDGTLIALGALHLLQGFARELGPVLRRWR